MEQVNKQLERGADVHARNEYGKTALMLAAESNGNPEIIKILLDKGADIEARDKDGWTVCDYMQENKALKKTNLYSELRCKKSSAEREASSEECIRPDVALIQIQLPMSRAICLQSSTDPKSDCLKALIKAETQEEINKTAECCGLFKASIPDNSNCPSTNCLSILNCAFESGLLHCHSHSFKTGKNVPLECH